MTQDEKYMQRCIELASNGLGNVAPNPMVGAVMVHENKITGEGFHQQYGQAHAEVNALNRAIADSGESLLANSILYVNLEPCSHTGKTPPCTDLIIEKKIKKIIIGNIDPYEKVSGSGIRKLKSAGVEVVQGILEDDCRELNKRFFTFHQKKRPYVILKYAQSMDGFIAPANATAENRWITNEYSRQRVHQWRSEEQAILVGTNTARKDNPSLTVRDWSGKNPLRIVLDRDLSLNNQLHLFDHSTPTYVINERKNEKSENLEFIQLDFSNNFLKELLSILHQRNIQSMIVEGGAKLLQSFIDENLWDEARIFYGSQFLNHGLKAPALTGTITSEEQILNDKLVVLKP